MLVFEIELVKQVEGNIDYILMPAVSRFGGGSSGNRIETKKRVIDRLLAYFEKYMSKTEVMGCAILF